MAYDYDTRYQAIYNMSRRNNIQDFIRVIIDHLNPHTDLAITRRSYPSQASHFRQSTLSVPFHEEHEREKQVFSHSTRSLNLSYLIFLFLSIISIISQILRFNDKPKFPGPTPFVNPFGPNIGAYSSGTQLNCKFALPC